MLTRMAPLLTRMARMARMLTRMTRWLAYYTHSLLLVTIDKKMHVYMLWFNFILGLNFIFLCFKLITMHYLTQKQRKIKFKPRVKLNHNIYYIKYLLI